MNFHPAGPHQSTAYLAIFDRVETTKERIQSVRTTMLLWADGEQQALRFVLGHHRNVDPEQVVLHKVDPRHHLGQKRVVLNVTLPLLEPLPRGCRNA